MSPPHKGPIPSTWTLYVLFLQVDDDAPIMIFYNDDDYDNVDADDMMMVMPVMMQWW